MNKIFILLLAFSLNTHAQSKGPLAIDIVPTNRTLQYIPEDALVVVAYGNPKKNSEVAPDRPIERIKDGTVATIHVRETDRLKRSRQWLTALYLRPVEEPVVNRTVWPLVPALLLEATPTLSVTTPSGPKTISQLKKGDVLYRYEPPTQQFSIWEVGIVKRKSRRAESSYSLVTGNDGFLFDNMVAMDQ